VADRVEAGKKGKDWVQREDRSFRLSRSKGSGPTEGKMLEKEEG